MGKKSGKSHKNKSKKSEKVVEKVIEESDDEVASVEDVEVEDEVIVDEHLEAESADQSNDEKVQESFETIYNRMLENISSSLKLQKDINRDNKLLLKLHNREIRLARKNRRSKNSANRRNVKSGFNKPTPVPEPVAKLFDIEAGTLLARTVVTKMIYQYIRDNGLQNPENKRQINPDSKIKKLFQLSKGDTLSFENFQTHMKKLYPPSKKDLEAKAAKEAKSNA